MVAVGFQEGNNPLKHRLIAAQVPAKLKVVIQLT